MRMKISSLCALGLAGLVACSNEGGGATPAASTSAKAASPATTAAATATATAPAKATATANPVQAAALVDFDLSTADPKWKGWTAKGPADAKVLADGVQGARIAAKGPSILDQKKGGDNGFDLAFAWGKDDLKALRKNIQKGADSPVGNVKVKLTFTRDEPDTLEWTTEVGDSKTYSFEMHIKVGKADITCKNNYMVGSGNPDEHKRVMDACKTLNKK
jgi:hypothetical protein